MMRRFTSAPNPADPGGGVHGHGVLGVDPQPVADAVVAGQVGGGLTRGDQVVGGQAEDHLGDRDLLDPGPGGGAGLGGLADPGHHVGIGAVEELGEHADGQAGHPVVEDREHPRASAG